mmetsp:Transcript_43638/g.113736  ORF Transcript_43638/g.113736 Transcript_43638/m.113736 type:complete len:208 (+) Transcript_43638:623-1246(+)
MAKWHALCCTRAGQHRIQLFSFSHLFFFLLFYQLNKAGPFYLFYVRPIATRGRYDHHFALSLSALCRSRSLLYKAEATLRARCHRRLHCEHLCTTVAEKLTEATVIECEATTHIAINNEKAVFTHLLLSFQPLRHLPPSHFLYLSSPHFVEYIVFIVFFRLFQPPDFGVSCSLFHPSQLLFPRPPVQLLLFAQTLQLQIFFFHFQIG